MESLSTGALTPKFFDTSKLKLSKVGFVKVINMSVDGPSSSFSSTPPQISTMEIG